MDEAPFHHRGQRAASRRFHALVRQAEQLLLPVGTGEPAPRGRPSHRRDHRRVHARELVGGHVADREEILAIGDVTTTGGSTMKAPAGLAEERNCTVRWGLSIVDREQGAAAELARHGVKLVSIFTKADFGLQSGSGIERRRAPHHGGRRAEVTPIPSRPGLHRPAGVARRPGRCHGPAASWRTSAAPGSPSTTDQFSH